MNVKGRTRDLSEEEVDRIVVAQADDDSVWGKPIRVRRTRPVSLSLPPELAARAAFFARLHREEELEEWLRRIIQERIDLEEAAFAGLKRDLLAKNSPKR
jgi:hypothetical protein